MRDRNNSARVLLCLFCRFSSEILASHGFCELELWCIVSLPIVAAVYSAAAFRDGRYNYAALIAHERMRRMNESNYPVEFPSGGP